MAGRATRAILRSWPTLSTEPSGTTNQAICAAFGTSGGVEPPNDALDGAGSCESGPGLASPQARHGPQPRHPFALTQAARNHKGRDGSSTTDTTATHTKSKHKGNQRTGKPKAPEAEVRPRAGPPRSTDPSQRP